ncbi:MAG: homocitrate synthase [Deltaproteobacteria bacterium]|nr:homocitrate synthase [Deltaproteobacteria bacterium]
MRPKVKLADATLRDGEQAPGLAFSLATRLELAQALDRAGIYRLEAGCPAMGPKEVEAVKAIKDVCANAQVAAWNRIRSQDVLASLRAGVDVVHLCLPVGEAHLARKIRKPWAELIADLAVCLSLARERGALVSVGLEDASRASLDELNRAADSLAALEVQSLRLSDTVGALTPGQTRRLVGHFVGLGFRVEFHGHNDLGLAEANSFVAALAGAEILDATLAGVGERAGNCGLSRLLAFAAERLDFGLTLKEAEALEELARPKLERRLYVQRLIKAGSPGLEASF